MSLSRLCPRLRGRGSGNARNSYPSDAATGVHRSDDDMIPSAANARSVSVRVRPSVGRARRTKGAHAKLHHSRADGRTNGRRRPDSPFGGFEEGAGEEDDGASSLSPLGQTDGRTYSGELYLRILGTLKRRRQQQSKPRTRQAENDQHSARVGKRSEFVLSFVRNFNEPAITTREWRKMSS